MELDPPKYIIAQSNEIFSGLADFLPGDIPYEHGGFINKKKFLSI
jgi:hypothetical protein